MTGAPLPLWWGLRAPSSPAASVLLLPDAQRVAASWPEALLEGLASQGLQIALVDLRDQGRSPWLPPDTPYSIGDVAEDVVPLLAELAPSPGPTIVVGHGFGASVALELAERRPELVDGLVLVGGSGWFVDPELPGPEEPIAVGLIWRARLAAAAEGRSGGLPAAGSAERRSLAAAMGRELRLLAGASDDPGREAALEEVERWLAWGYNLADRQRTAWLTAPDRWSTVRRRCHPLAVVHGADDPLVPLAHGLRLATLADTSARVVAGAGHAPSPPLVSATVHAVASMVAPAGATGAAAATGSPEGGPGG